MGRPRRESEATRATKPAAGASLACPPPHHPCTKAADPAVVSQLSSKSGGFAVQAAPTLPPFGAPLHFCDCASSSRLLLSWSPLRYPSEGECGQPWALCPAMTELHLAVLEQSGPLSPASFSVAIGQLEPPLPPHPGSGCHLDPSCLLMSFPPCTLHPGSDHAAQGPRVTWRHRAKPRDTTHRWGWGGVPQLVQCFYFGFLILKEAQEFVFISFFTIISTPGLFEMLFCDKNLKSSTLIKDICK